MQDKQNVWLVVKKLQGDRQFKHVWVELSPTFPFGHVETHCEES